MGQPTTWGWVAVSSALLGLLALFGYGAFATRGIYAAHSRDMIAAHRMALYAGGFSLAQFVLGMLAIGLGWVASARGGNSRLAQGLGALACGFGVVVLLFQMMILV